MWVAAWLPAMKVGVVGTHAYTYLMPHAHAYLLNLVRPKVVIADSVTLGNDYFLQVGCADDIAKVSGVWVSPLEIERALQECPGVKECVAAQDKGQGRVRVYQGQGVCGTVEAFVVPTDGTKAGAQALADMQEELKRFCRERLAPHKISRAVEFMGELPKTGQGKIDQRLLQERAL